MPGGRCTWSTSTPPPKRSSTKSPSTSEVTVIVNIVVFGFLRFPRTSGSFFLTKSTFHAMRTGAYSICGVVS